jgi:hypothetical protein
MIDDPEDEAWDELERKQAKKWDTLDMAYRSGGLTIKQSTNSLDIADRAYFAGKQAGIAEAEAIAKLKDKNNG